MKKVVGFILLAAVIGGGIYVYPKAMLYFQGKKNINLTKSIDFFVSSNSDFNELVKQLANQGIIDDTATFKNYSNERNLTNSTLEPGKYQIEPGDTWNDLVTNLRKGYGEQEVKLTFNNTRTLKEIAEKITKNIEPTEEQFYQYITTPEVQRKYGFNEHTIRTIFIPNTYNVWWDISVEELLKRMAEEYKSFWTDERKAKANEIGLSQSEVSTLASIVYTETAKVDEAPKIAGVYMNRLKLGMPLQADPTLIFAIGDFTIKRVLNKDKEIESPYNTYKYTGLPPGPIYVSPISYIDAVLNYQKHDYLYFCAKEDFSGYSNFAKTLSQHNVNARKYQKALNERNLYR